MIVFAVLILDDAVCVLGGSHAVLKDKNARPSTERNIVSFAAGRYPVPLHLRWTVCTTGVRGGRVVDNLLGQQAMRLSRSVPKKRLKLESTVWCIIVDSDF